jgi:hypothetical protein
MPEDGCEHELRGGRKRFQMTYGNKVEEKLVGARDGFQWLA